MIYPLAVPLERAAEVLGVGRRWLLEWLWKNPCDQNGTPFYRKAGRTKLFTELDIARILAALPTPEVPFCPSSSSRRAGATRTMQSGGPTSGSDYIEARELLRKLSQQNSCENGNKTSKVVPYSRNK